MNPEGQDGRGPSMRHLKGEALLECLVGDNQENSGLGLRRRIIG